MDFSLNEEQRMWKDAVHDFVENEVKPKAAELDESHELNWPAIRKMGQIGLLGLNISEQYGGTGLDAISAAIAIEELGVTGTYHYSGKKIKDFKIHSS